MITLVAGMHFHATVVCAAQNQVAINTVDYRVVSASGPLATDFDLAGDMDSHLSAEYLALMSVNCDYVRCEVQVYYPGLNVRASVNSSTGSGTGTGADLPTQVSYVIGKLTQLAGRKYRGRIYPGFPCTNHANGQGGINGTGLAALAALAAKWQSMAATFLTNSNVDAKPILQDPTIPGGFTDITGFTARAKFGTQRSRGQYGAPNVLS
jgi:hypothetical protein